MKTIKQNIEFTKGDTYPFAIEFEGLNQSLETVFLTCRDGQSVEDTLLFQLSLGDGIEEDIVSEENEDGTTIDSLTIDGSGFETLTTVNTQSYTPTDDYHPSTKVYTDKTHYEKMTGYDATKTQTLKNINGTLTWVDDE